MQAREKKPALSRDSSRESLPEGVAESLEGWFVEGAVSETRPAARPKSVPPTGDDEVDRWLR